MKKFVQRFALLALMMLPMLAGATVPVPTVNYPVRGTVSVVTDEDVDFDIVRLTPNTGYQATTPDLWDITGASIDGTDIKVMNTYELWVRKTNETITALRVKFAPQTPTLAVTAANGSFTLANGDPLAASYAYGTHLTLKAVPDANYNFAGAVWKDASDNILGSYDGATDEFDFYITENTTIYGTFEGATCTLTLNITPALAMDEAAGLWVVAGTTYTAPLESPYSADPGIVIGTTSLPAHYHDFTYTYTVNDVLIHSGDKTELSGSADAYTIHNFGREAVFTVNYIPDNYTITVVSDDDMVGTVTGTGSYAYGTNATIEATPIDDAQYAFKEWNDGNTVNPRTVAVEGDATYTAYFKNTSFPITLSMETSPAGGTSDGSFRVKKDGEDAVAYDPDVEYDYSSHLQIYADNGTNYTFLKWSDESVENPRDVYVWNATSVNLTAIYQAESYDVTFATNSELTLVGNGSYPYGTEATVTATENNADAYTFTGWQVGGVTVSTDASYTFTVTEDVELTALYEPVTYTITAVTSTGDDSEGTVSPAMQEVPFGSTFTLTATPATGYVFKHWNEPTLGDKTAVEMTNATLNASNAGHVYTWTASFGPMDINIAIDDPDAAYGITITTPSPIVTSYGATVNEPVYTNADANMYEVTGWKDAADNDIVFPYTVNVTSDITIHAVIEGTPHTLTLTAATYADETSATLRYGTTFTLTPVVPEGKEFKNWKVNGADDSDDPDHVFTMGTGNMSIEAIFEDVHYTVSATANPAGAATFTGTGTDFTYGAEATIVVAMDEHYTFANWSDDASAAMTPRVVTVNSDTNLVANFTPNTYNISVAVNDANMGTASCDVTELAYGSPMYSHLAVTENAGYHLKEWRTAEDVTITQSDMLTWTYDGTATLTAIFDYQDIVVSAIIKDSDAVADHDFLPVVCAIDGDRYVGGIVTITAPTIEGWHFIGWEDGKVTETAGVRTDTLTALNPVEFNAIFARNVYTVTLVVDENKGENATGAGSYRFEDVVTLGVDAKAGYTFAGWKDAEDNDVASGFSIAADMTLTAQFTTNTYDVTASAGANGSVAPASIADVEYNTEYTLTATPNFGYAVSEWVSTPATETLTGNTITPTLTVASDIAWEVTFVKRDIAVTVNIPADVDEEVMGTAVAAPTTTHLGDNFTITPTANAGYKFVKIHGEESGNDYTELSANYVAGVFTFAVNSDGDDTTFTVVFERDQFTVTAASDDPAMGTVSMTPATMPADYKTAVTLTATPIPGYEFVKWSNGTEAEDYTEGNVFNTTVPAADITWTAYFQAATYTIKAVANTDVMGTATVNGATETTAAFGSSITFAYTENEGYEFVNWTNSSAFVIDPAAETVPVDGDTYTANFHALQFDITLAANFDARGTVEFTDDHTSTKHATFGQSYDIEATPAYGYVFTGWSDGEEGTNLTRTVTLPHAADYTLTANFDYQPYTVTVNYNADSADVTVNGEAYTAPVEISYTQVANIVVTPKEHYHIVNGVAPYTNASPLAFDTTVLSDIKFTYYMLPDTHAVVFSILPAASYGSITGGVDGNYAYGTEIELTAVPFDEHYSFVEWEDNTTDMTRTVTVEGDTTFRATFEAMKYQFTVSSDNTEMGNVTGTATGEYDYNTSISVTAVAEDGYHFVNWVDEDDNEVSTDVNYEFNITEPTTIKAVFDYNTYTLRIETPVREMGYLMIDDDSLGYVANGYVEQTLPTHTDIEIAAIPNNGYLFGAWSDDPAITDSVRTIQITGNTTITATFGFQQFDITLAVNDDARGTAEFDGTYNRNYSALDTIKATAYAGFHFVHWAEDGNTEARRMVPVLGDATYTAVFAYDTVDIANDECDTVIWDGDEYYESDVVVKNYTDVLGLDSIVRNTITVRHSTTATDPHAICYNGSLTWNGDTYDADNTEGSFVTVNAVGCDSTVTLELTVYENRSVEESVEDCHPYTWDYTGITYDTPGDHVTGSSADINGCDSTTTLHLTFITVEDIHLDGEVACDSYTWTVPGEEDQVISASGDYDKPYTYPGTSCTAHAYLHLTIQESIHETLAAVTACDEYEWIYNGNTVDTYTDGGDKVYEWNDGVCDNDATLPLTINYNTSTDFDDVTACDSYQIVWTDGTTQDVTTTDTYIHNYNTADGCPSTDQITVTINNSNTGVDVQTACDTYTWIDGETYTESNNTATYTIAGGNQYGCDSTVTLNLTINSSDATTDVQVACDSYEWIDGQTYTASNNTATYTLTNAAGCDSVVTLNLTVNNSQVVALPAVVACDSYEFNGHPYTASEEISVLSTGANACDSTTTLSLTINYNSSTVFDDVTACDSYQITWTDGTTQDVTTTSTYTHDYNTADGCPSTDQINVTIKYKVTVDEYAEACDTYTWNDLPFTESGNVTVNNNGGAANGCDSITTLHLTIQHTADNVLDAVVACDQYEWIFNGVTVDTYTTSGDKVYEYAEGLCEHNTATLPLTINTPANTTESAIACESYTWAVNGQTYTASDTYTADITDANGCAATATLTLTINNGEDVEVSEVACGTYHWDVSGFDYDATGDYPVNVNDGNGCVYTATLHLTINTPEAGNKAEEAICEGATYTWNDAPYTTAGEYYFDRTDANSCTVTDTLVLTVNVPAAGTKTAEAICPEATYTWNEEPYTAAGEYYFNNTDANGCTVVDTLVLTVNTPEAGTKTEEAVCEGVTYTWNDAPYTTAGEYYFDRADANGCAVVDTLVLTVNAHAAGSKTEEAVCDGTSYTWASSGLSYTAASTYYYDYADANGCTVTDTLVLTVNIPEGTSETAEACGSYTWAANGQTYTTSGNYSTSITDANGCTATATLALTINNAQNVVENATACDSYTWTRNGQTYTIGGVYTAEITDANGCPATATLSLTVNAAQNTTATEAACDSYTWTVNNQTYTTSGTYTDSFTDANGCAATATLNLTVNQSVTNTVNVSGEGSVTYNNVTYTESTVVTENLATVSGCDSVVTVNITVVPVVEEDTMTIVLSVNDATMGSITPAAGTYYYTAGDTVVATATANNGYNFVGWAFSYEMMGFQVGDTLTDNPFNLVVEDYYFDYGIYSINFVAVFEADTTPVVVDSVYHLVSLLSADTLMGTVSDGDSVLDGESFTATAYPNNGYRFAYWMDETGDSVSADNPYTFTVSADITLTAAFAADSTPVDTTTYYYITLISADTLMGIVAPSDSMAMGSRFTAYAIANEGYHFVNWTDENGDSVSTENPYIFTVVADATLIANFAVDSTPVVDTVYYTVTVNYDATMGTVTGEGRYVEGTIVTLRATANEGYTFNGWYDGSTVVATTAEYTFTVSADVTLTAAFEAIPVYYTVVGQANDAAMGTVLGSGEYQEGATATLTAQAYTGYHFVHWSNGETTPSITFTVTEDVTVIAYFEADEEPQAIDETDLDNVTIYSAETRIIVSGAEGKTVSVYDINGRTVSTQNAVAETVEFRMAATGVYLVKVGNAPAKRVLVVR